jgi:putative transposase
MIRNLKYRLYGCDKSRDLSELVTTANHVYNHVVALYRRFYRLYGKNPKSGAVKHHIAKLAKRNPMWSLMGSQSLQEICERVEASYKEFFKKNGHGRPSFRKAALSGSFAFKGSVGYTLNGNSIRINKLGFRYRFKLTRDYGLIHTVRIKRDNRGKLWLVLCCEVPEEHRERQGDACIGVDFGLKHFITTSDGEVIDAPLGYRQSLNEVRKRSRNLSRKQKDSNGRKRAKDSLARLHEGISNRRTDFQWKLAHRLCRENSYIAIENLSMKGMQKRWGRKVSDLGWAEFVQRLVCVAEKYGTEVVQIGRFEASSQVCSECGYRNTETKNLSLREWTCPHCGAHHDRDVNAAINILSIAKGGKGTSLGRSRSKSEPAFADAAAALIA